MNNLKFKKNVSHARNFIIKLLDGSKVESRLNLQTGPKILKKFIGTPNPSIRSIFNLKSVRWSLPQKLQKLQDSRQIHKTLT
jgi:hypothetical protein